MDAVRLQRWASLTVEPNPRIAAVLIVSIVSSGAPKVSCGKGDNMC